MCREQQDRGMINAKVRTCPQIDEFLRLRSQESAAIFNTSLFVGDAMRIDWCSPEVLSLWFIAGTNATMDVSSSLQDVLWAFVSLERVGTDGFPRQVGFSPAIIAAGLE